MWCCYFSCESLHAFYFYVKQVCVLITVNQWRCQRWNGHVPINISSFDTRISLVNIVTQKTYSFEAVNRTTKLPCDINFSRKLMSKSLKLEEVSIYSQVKSNQIKPNQIYFSVAGNNNTQYKSRPIHLRIWHSATEGMDGQTSWH